MANKNATSDLTSPSADMATNTPATEIVLADGQKVIVREANKDVVLKFLNGGMLDEREETSEQIAQRMVSQVFAAQSFLEALESSQATHAQDYLDRPIVIRDVTWNQSSFVDEHGVNLKTGEQQLRVFAVIDAVNGNGEKVTLTTGAFMPCAMMYSAQVRGDLSSVRVKFVKRDRPTKNGFYPLNLVAAD